MYICICSGVTDNAIQKAVDQGARRMRDLRTCLGVAGQCGACAFLAKAMLEKSLAQQNPDTSTLF